MLSQMRAGQLFPRTSNETLSRNGSFAVSEHSVEVGSDGARVDLIVCRPAAATRPVPYLYYMHGGGMVAGTHRDGLPEVLDLAEQVGAAVVSVNYRLAPESPAPGPVEDSYGGLVWTVENADVLGLTATTVVLIGGSAGAGIAAGVALLARDRGGPALTGQLLMCPMLDDRNNTVSAQQMSGLPTWNRAMNAFGWSSLLGDAAGGPDVSQYAAPARATDLSRLPPTFVDVGSRDTFRDEDVIFASRIWQHGGAAELHVWPGGYHGFDVFAPDAPLSVDAVRARTNWLRRLLG